MTQAPTIPKNIFQTWKTKDLRQMIPAMREAIESNRRLHPDYLHEIYDDRDAREFIRREFPARVLKAYDTIKPGAFKADLWRYCILYKRGGWYLDIKMRLSQRLDSIKGFTPMTPVLVRDGRPRDLFQAVLAFPARHPFLENAINQCVSNIDKRYYGPNPLSITGPYMLGRLYDRMYGAGLIHPGVSSRGLMLQHDSAQHYKASILDDTGRVVMQSFRGYYEKRLTRGPNRYHAQWHERRVYGEKPRKSMPKQKVKQKPTQKPKPKVSSTRRKKSRQRIQKSYLTIRTSKRSNILSVWLKCKTGRGK